MADLNYMMGFLKAQLDLLSDEDVLYSFDRSFISRVNTTLRKLNDIVNKTDKFYEGYEAFSIKSFFNFSDDIFVDRLFDAYEWSVDDFLFSFSSYDDVVDSDYYIDNLDNEETSALIRFIDKDYKRFWISFYDCMSDLVKFLNKFRYEDDINEIADEVKKRLGIDIDYVKE